MTEFEIGFGELMERERAGAQIMGTEIEGQGKLAKVQQYIERRQAGTQNERRMLNYFIELSDIYKNFSADDEVVLKDKFSKLPHSKYKNPLAFLLAEIILREGNGEITKKGLNVAKGLIKETNQVGFIIEEDLVRYCRLLKNQNNK